MRRARTASEESVFATAMPTTFTASMHGVIRIRYKYIPAYLHQGAFFSNLSSDEQGQPFDIPSDCFLPSDTVRDIFEFAQMLRVCMFWGLPEIPRGLYIFCSSVRHDIWIGVAREVFYLNREWLKKLQLDCKNYRSIGSAIKTGHPEVVNHWIESNPYNPEDVALNDAIIQAVAAGNLPLVVQLRERNYPWHEQTSVVAAYCGHLHCLEFILQHGCPLSPDTMAWAAEGGHLDCLQYAHQQGCPFNKYVFKYAARRGHVDCIAYLLAQRWPWDPCVTLDYMPAHCLEYVLSRHCTVHREAFKLAAQQGRLVCLGLLCTHLEERDPSVVDAAAEYGQTEVLEYALENGFPVTTTACSLAAYNGHLTCLRVLRKFDAPWEESVLTLAAKDGNLDILQFALENQCPCRDSVTLLSAVVYSGINVASCLRYLIDTLSLEMTPELYCVALERGDVDTILYLVDAGCTCIYTSAHRNLKIGEDSHIVACIAYTMEHGFPCSDDLLAWVTENKLESCLQYIKDNGQNAEFRTPEGEMSPYWEVVDYFGSYLR